MALDFALLTLSNKQKESSPNSHLAAAITSGAFGGACGKLTALFELPVSTLIMLRSIADIARSYGEDLLNAETRLQCLEVLALGGTSFGHGRTSGYFKARGAYARLAKTAAKYITERGLGEKTTSTAARFITKILPRFEAQFTTKLCVEAAPLLGAISGAAINAIFIDHFQDVARGHFAVRKLERLYGKKAVKAAYDKIKI